MSDRWTPIRRGNVYCSPACGSLCTYADYERAVKHADDLCKLLGEGWKPIVWENMRWHYKAAFELSNGWSMKVFYHHGKYYAVLGEGDSGNIWKRRSGLFEDPKDAVRDEWAAFQEWLMPIKAIEDLAGSNIARCLL